MIKEKEEPVALADHEEDDLAINKETAIVVDQEGTVKANQEETTIIDRKNTLFFQKFWGPRPPSVLMWLRQ